MTLTIGDTAPDFTAESSEGTISLHEWLGDSWGVIFSHPKDFTPICTTELGVLAKIKPEFDKRGVKILALSVDPVEKHAGWAADIEKSQGAAPNYPLVGDADFAVSKAYGMLGADVSGDPSDRTAADNQTVRGVYVIGPDKKIKLILLYPMTTGRNFDEILRVIDSLQLTAKNKVATPANWKQGDDVVIASSVSNDAAKEIFGEWDRPCPTSGSSRSRPDRLTPASQPVRTPPVTRRSLQPEVVAQRLAGVLGAEPAAALQDRHDVVDERGQLIRQRRSHDGESVDCARVLPGRHVIGELLGCAHEVGLPGAAGHVLGDLPQRGVRPGPCGGVEQLRAARRRRLIGPQLSGQGRVRVEGVGIQPGRVQRVLPPELRAGQFLQLPGPAPGFGFGAA